MIECYINNSAVSLLTNSLSIEDEIGIRSITSFTVRDDTGSLEFEQGMPMRIEDNGTIITQGYVDSSTKYALSSAKFYAHDVECIDMVYLADKRLISYFAYNKLAGDVVKDLVDEKLAEEGVTYITDIINTDTTTADFSEGTLTDVEAVDDSLQLANNEQFPCENPLYSSKVGNLFITPRIRDGADWQSTVVSISENLDTGFSVIETTASNDGIWQEFSGLTTSVYYTCSYLVRYISGSQLIGSHFDGNNQNTRIDKGSWNGYNRIEVPDDGQYHLIEVRGYPDGTSSDRIYIQPGRKDDTMSSSIFEVVYGRFEKGDGAQKIEFRKNVALNKSVSVSSSPTKDEPLSSLVDGVVNTSPYVSLDSGLQYVQIDLGSLYDINEIKVWHYFGDGRTYHDTKTQVSSDGQDWVTVFDSATEGEYTETAEGHTISFDTKNIRYIRDYLNGSTSNIVNLWVEIKVFIPATAINIETSVDNGLTWQTVTNGGSIPNISGASTLDVRQTLSTDDTTVTPVLESLTVEVETPIQHNWSLDTSTPSSWNDVSNPLTQSSEGEWYLHTRHFEDNNPVTEYTGTYNIDKTPPAVPNVNLTNNTSHSFSLDWTNDDSLSGIDYVELYAKTSDGTVIDINGDSNTEDYITLTATDDTYTVDGLSEYSDYDYKVITYDKAGNSSADGFYTMTTDDITEPVIGYNVNSTSWQNTDVDETVNVDDAGGSGVANAWYKWTNSATQPTDGWVVMGTTTDFSTSQSQKGEWYLHIKATDNYDNTAYDYSGAYKIDKTVPTISSTNISIDSPTGIYDTYTATVTWTIEDDRAGVDRTEIGFYVDGAWYYDETNLPDGMTTDIDMDNVTGNGSKTATFSNVPREIDIATSWQGYDIATNETVEEQSETVYTPRIYETYTTVAPTSYEIGKTDTLIIPTEYEIGITDSTQSPSEYIIDVLSKSTSAPSVYGIGLTQASTIAPSEYEIGITDSKSAPSLYDIIALYDEPILVSGKYKQGLRIGTSDIEVDVSEFSGGWTMHLFRRGEQDKEFRDIFALSSGDVYIDGEVDESYDTSWFTHTEDKITIKSGAIDIDELLIIPYELVPSEIKTLTGSAFYDTSPNITIGKPSTANMEVL